MTVLSQDQDEPDYPPLEQPKLSRQIADMAILPQDKPEHNTIIFRAKYLIYKKNKLDKYL